MTAHKIRRNSHTAMVAPREYGGDVNLKKAYYTKENQEQQAQVMAQLGSKRKI